MAERRHSRRPIICMRVAICSLGSNKVVPRTLPKVCMFSLAVILAHWWIQDITKACNLDHDVVIMQCWAKFLSLPLPHTHTHTQLHRVCYHLNAELLPSGSLCCCSCCCCWGYQASGGCWSTRHQSKALHPHSRPSGKPVQRAHTISSSTSSLGGSFCQQCLNRMAARKEEEYVEGHI